jgi:hypothetical protein
MRLRKGTIELKQGLINAGKVPFFQGNLLTDWVKMQISLAIWATQSG